MEHEMYVPFPVQAVRQALTEPPRVARCVPGVQLDADTVPDRPQGRLRLRIGGSTITYRGSLSVSGGATGAGPGAGTVTIEAHGTEARGEGTAALTLEVRLAPSADPGPGTTLRCSGTLRSGGRLAEADGRAAQTAGRRLLDRFAANLAADLEQHPAPDADADSGPACADRPHGGVFDVEVPPPSLDPYSDADAAAGQDEEAAATYDGTVFDGENYDGQTYDGESYDGEDDDGATPAEAAHARRTMIGRSAEEVDHAPPRGRYAPVPVPEAHGTSALRWAAPAAAVVLASVVVVGRALRRRR
ncbi:SRPBCC domain-containing protein [Streptomyces pinistramenti]|uniref:SRPBCC domain-containing protein n=1 Tax=Streptomyces pinistramenti TaxID=2884812 RepID=UPI001D067B3D|nr:SRPBCC domain-containing protein [Streptomyces pinistramenti]MCB5908585.1 carbon monoxide dehydrogenase subunit G [Streptomyces pinistramenti]